MDLVFSILIFAALGLTLLAAVLWYGRLVHTRFFAANLQPEFAAFEIIGVDEATARSYSTSLPKMTLARLNALRDRTNAAIAALDDAKHALERRTRPADARYNDLPVPERFATPIDVEFKIADLDAGGLISFLVEQARKSDRLQVSVAFDDASSDAPNAKAQVFGYLPGKAGYSFHREPQNEPREVIKEIAAAIVQLSAQQQHPGFAVLEADAFETMFEALADYAQLEKSRSLTGRPNPQGYAQVLAEIKPHADKYELWVDLQWLTSQVAERAEDWLAARTYYGNLLEITDKEDSRADLVEAKLAYLDERIAVRNEAVQRVAATGSTSPQQVESELQSLQRQRRVGLERPDQAAVLPLLKLLGARRELTGSGVTIAVAGGAPWPSAVEEDKVRFLRPGDPPAGDQFADYQTELLQAMRLVVPDAEFLYVGSPTRSSYGTVELLDELQLLIEQRPDVLLLPLKIDWSSKIITDIAAEGTKQGITFVFSAGNDAVRRDFDALPDLALVAAATDLTGAPAPFTSHGRGVVWAPGVDIPVVSAVSGKQALRSGTGFSGAFAAAAAALLAAAPWEAEAQTIVAALKTTARPALGRKEPPILNIAEAVRHLESQRTAQAAKELRSGERD